MINVIVLIIYIVTFISFRLPPVNYFCGMGGNLNEMKVTFFWWNNFHSGFLFYLTLPLLLTNKIRLLNSRFINKDQFSPNVDRDWIPRSRASGQSPTFASANKYSKAGCICLFSYRSRINKRIIDRIILLLQIIRISKGIFQLDTFIIT